MFKKTSCLLAGGVTLMALAGCGASHSRSVSTPLKSLPVQYNGRVQPFDTFARNSLKLIYGKPHFHQKPARDIVLSWALIPGFWNQQDFIHIPGAAVKKSLKLNERQQWFSPYKLLNNQTFRNQLQQLNTMRQSKTLLSSYFKSVQKLESRLALFQAIARGQVPGFIPPWSKDFTGEEEEWVPAFAGMTGSFAGMTGASVGAGSSPKGFPQSSVGAGPPQRGFPQSSVGADPPPKDFPQSSVGAGPPPKDFPQSSSEGKAPSVASAGNTDASAGENSTGKTDSMKGVVTERKSIPLPAPSSMKKAQSVHKYRHEAHKAFGRIITTYVEALASKISVTTDTNQTLKPHSPQPHHLNPGSRPLPGDQEQLLSQAVQDFKNILKNHHSGYGGHLSKMGTELHYNALNPFRVSWILYLVGLLLLLTGRLPVFVSQGTGRSGFFRYLKKASAYLWPFKKPSFPRKRESTSHFGIANGLSFLALLSLFVAFFIQGYGMLLRCLIMGRPPVTNMYETVVWVPWVAFILGTLLWKTQKFFAAFVCGAILCLFCLLLADQASVLLDGSLQPLEAVLRSGFWLSTHVLVITISYGAFFLAFVLGDVGLFFFLTRKKIPFVYIRSIDRCMQVGVVALAAGTVLGGIWADYSWGRFWGWDPKETWALISLLGYLALLHGRLAGWLKEFGLVVGAVLMFFLIVMAWYGVNYVLGQGLHSYGFGAGGVEYVSAFALAHLIYVILVWTFKDKTR